MAKIGFIGLGIMGAHMARNLIKGGHSLFVSGTHPVPEDLGKATTVIADSTAVAQAADIVVIMVPDTPDVANVLFADDGVAKGLTAGTLVIDMSSISPLDTQAFAKTVNELGCDYLDAPVSGGEVGARDATLTIMVGGPEKAFERALPLLELMGKNISLIGDNGAGQTCKAYWFSAALQQPKPPNHSRTGVQHWRGWRRSMASWFFHFAAW
jgi:2-hydroxy-3-oxopropionate reductase